MIRLRLQGVTLTTVVGRLRWSSSRYERCTVTPSPLLKKRKKENKKRKKEKKKEKKSFIHIKLIIGLFSVDDLRRENALSSTPVPNKPYGFCGREVRLTCRVTTDSRTKPRRAEKSARRKKRSKSAFSCSIDSPIKKQRKRSRPNFIAFPCSWHRAVT